MIDEISRELGGLGDGVVYTLLAFTVFLLVAQLVALVDLARRENVLWDRKWLWVLVILFVSSGVGVLLWFVLGRRVPQESASRPVEGAQDEVATRRAVDLLYGDDHREGR